MRRSSNFDERERALAQKKRETHEVHRIAIGVFVGIVVMIAALKIAHAYIVYGELRCAFEDCRIVVDAKEPATR